MLTYNFVAEHLANGKVVKRPKVPIRLENSANGINVIALLDSGSDTTVIPEPLAKFLKLSYDPNAKTIVETFQGVQFRCVQSVVDIIFRTPGGQRPERVNAVPILIALESMPSRVYEDVIIGVERIFDEFDITFSKRKNQIMLRKRGQSPEFS